MFLFFQCNEKTEKKTEEKTIKITNIKKASFKSDTLSKITRDSVKIDTIIDVKIGLTHSLNTKHNSNTEPERLSSPINLLDTPCESFKLDLNKKVVVKAKNGTKITFPKMCFGLDTQVELNIKECFLVSDMIFNQLDTRTLAGDLLKSEGMLFIEVKNKKGELLSLREGYELEIELPTKEKKLNVKIFIGEKNNEKVQWDLKDDNNGMTTFEFIVPDEDDPDYQLFLEDEGLYYLKKREEEIKVLNYTFSTNKIGWINCDIFLNKNIPLTTFSLNSNEFIEDMSCYLIFHNFKSVLVESAKNNKFNFESLPIGEDVSILMIGAKEDKLKYNMIDSKLSKDLNINMNNFKIIGNEELKKILDNKFRSLNSN